MTATVHDVEGRLVRTLWRGPLAPGERTLVWDGADDRGAPVAGGVYLASVRTADSAATVKLVLVK
ncbi:MAG: hypothetical protein IPH09_04065 [bacterium]|nr:hypothetical protein [bacterium]